MVEVVVYLMNEKNTTVKVKTTDSSDDVLEVKLLFVYLHYVIYILMNYRKLQRKLNYKMNSLTILLCFLNNLMRSPNHGKVMV